MPQTGTLTAATWQMNLTQKNESLLARLAEIYGNDPEILQSRLPLYQQALDTFIKAYGADQEIIISRAPGRINLLGNHIEHRGGYVNYVAVNRETLLVASARDDDRVVIHNANPDRFTAREFSISDLLPSAKRGDWLAYIETVNLTSHDWENYIRAAILHLQDHFADTPLKGLNIAIAGDIPIAAGLSSSSSLVVSSLEAALYFNKLDIPHLEKAEFCGRAEWYAGTRGGAGDHAAMLYAQQQTIVHLQFFPLKTEPVALPAGYRVVACNSFVEHAPPGIFNERIATYEIGLMLIKKHFPQYTSKLTHLRDLDASSLGIDTASIYHMLKTLPERMTRDEILNALPEHTARLNTLFAPHSDPKEGYRIRQVVLFGLAECARGAQCKDLLESGNISGFGELKYLSHDGDRQFRYAPDGTETQVENRTTDADLDRLITDLESGDHTRIQNAQIHRQPGGYDCSCEALDKLVDLASRVKGVVGAGLTGGGLGGCVLVLVKEEAINTLVETLERDFYAPQNFKNGLLICASVGGSGIV
ncbi:MAG: N-acetylgalactosamine kinase [Candidatus Latescibacterota bacterium]|jgi:N-acetylgalactosamine kinase